MNNNYFYFLILLLTSFDYSYSNNNFIKIYKGLNSLDKETINLEELQKTNHSFHFLLPTVGRKSIFRMLKCLEIQTEPQDYVTIVFDAKDESSVYEEVKRITSNFNCKVSIIFETSNLGYWGHGIRNKYQELPGDFILHCDDDDHYSPEGILTMRKICQDKKKLYIFRMKFTNFAIWKEPKVSLGNIGTPLGAFPNKYNNLSKWGYYRGGDVDFYKDVSKKINPDNIIFVDYIIYKVRQAK